MRRSNELGIHPAFCAFVTTVRAARVGPREGRERTTKGGAGGTRANISAAWVGRCRPESHFRDDQRFDMEKDHRRPRARLLCSRCAHVSDHGGGRASRGRRAVVPYGRSCRCNKSILLPRRLHRVETYCQRGRHSRRCVSAVYRAGLIADVESIPSRRNVQVLLMLAMSDDTVPARSFASAQVVNRNRLLCAIQIVGALRHY